MTLLIKEETLRLIRGYSNDRYCLEILQYFAKFPCARFNRLAIVHVVNNGSLIPIKKSLQRLMEDKLVSTCKRSELVLYYLTEEMTQREAVLSLASFDFSNWQAVLKGKTTINIEERPGNARNSKYSFFFYGTPVKHQQMLAGLI